MVGRFLSVACAQGFSPVVLLVVLRGFFMEQRMKKLLPQVSISWLFLQ